MHEEDKKLGADSIYFSEVEGEDGLELSLEESLNNKFVGLVSDRYASAKQARDYDESRWINAYHNYRGLYPKQVKFRESEKSRVFVKVTKTKVLAAFGQLVDVVFGSNKLPIGISESKIPEGIAEYAHLDTSAPLPGIETTSSAPEPVKQRGRYDVGYAGDNVLNAGATYQDKGQFEDMDVALKDNLKDGPTIQPGVYQTKPAQEAARRMEKLIHDQIEESHGSSELRNALFEQALFGTGIIKGPFNFNKTLNRWTQAEDGTREYSPKEVRVPRIEFVSVWDFFPDPNATNMEECEYVFHRHKMNKSQLRGLCRMPYFNKDNIRTALQMGANYEPNDYEHELKDDQRGEDYGSAQFEVIEYWGVMDAESAREVGMELADEIDDLEEVQINAWICNGILLRAVVNPFTPYRIPYHAFPYERNPYSFFGIGVAENMDDSQKIMNGHARMAIDNLALSGSLVFDVDESALVGGQSMEIYPGKIFRRQAGVPGQAINGLKFPNTSNENMMMFDRFRQLADEQTGIPSYSHGQTGVQSMTRTASGMSMLLGAASLNIKTVIKNLDDFLLRPLGEAYFQWNMQFLDEKLNITGDLEVKATGTNSLMQKEVRSQRLTMFLQTAQNPAVAPFIKIDKLISELAYSLELDPDEILNNAEEAAVMAQIIGMQNNGQATGAPPSPTGEQQGAMGGATGVPPEGQDLGVTGTGGGNIGTGSVPQSGESEFSSPDGAA